MSQQKTSKRAVLVSALSLLLCVTLLIGTTWAWFTDSAVSSGNKIQSGTLKIDFLVKGGNTGYADYTSVKNDKKAIFNYNLWEPGYTLVTNAKVVNEGNLALKYTLRFTSDADIASEKLAEVIDVYYKAEEVNVTDRTGLDALTKLGTLKDVFAQGAAVVMNDTLEAQNDADYATIVLKMQESAGNEYQNLTISDFDMMILATQATVESDSFDNQYDAGIEPVAEGMNKVTKENIEYIYDNDGNYILYNVLPEYSDSKVNVPEGVNKLGDYSFYQNNGVEEVVLSSTVTDLGRAFDSSNVKKVTLNEGLTEISSRAFRKTASLEEVVIPSTVTKIVENAFQQSGIKELDIPENVTDIGVAAFGYCPELETLKIRGNATIANYASRGSAKLKDVYLYGDDVTFASGASMVFTNKENGDASGITFHVKNDTVKERLIAASGSCIAYGFNVVVDL